MAFKYHSVQSIIDRLNDNNETKPEKFIEAFLDDFRQQNQERQMQGESNPRMWQRRNISIRNNNGEIRPFTPAFAQFILQVARNLAPYRTGNLRKNITVDYSPYSIKIRYNTDGTAFYGMFLDNGYPTAKWINFIQHTREVVRVLCAWYQSQDDDTVGQNLNNAMKLFGVGGKAMSSLRALDDNTTLAKNRLRVSKLVTGWELERLRKEGSPTRKISPQTVGRLDVQSNPRIRNPKEFTEKMINARETGNTRVR